MKFLFTLTILILFWDLVEKNQIHSTKGQLII